MLAEKVTVCGILHVDKILDLVHLNAKVEIIAFIAYGQLGSVLKSPIFKYFIKA